MQDRVIKTYKRAYFDYEISETYTAGIVLTGTEVKSIRDGRVNIEGAYAKIEDGEVWLLNMDVAQYPFASKIFNHEPKRPRKLLLKKREIKRLIGKLSRRGFTLVPLKIFLSRGFVKIELGLAKGKKLYDKRQEIKRREFEKEMRKRYKYR
jgi:SsrA-binding protein